MFFGRLKEKCLSAKSFRAGNTMRHCLSLRATLTGLSCEGFAFGAAAAQPAHAKAPEPNSNVG
jgi:hypothetical protein